MPKPPYKVPSMAEIKNIKWNGLNVVSTFSGCGGSCLGYRMAGYRVLYANEFIPAAQDAYKLNHPDSYLDLRDIRHIKASEILSKINLEVGELDLFDGSPPCASFSSAGKREKGWGEEKDYSSTRQRTDDLFFEYRRLLEELQPKVFVAENVSGLIKGTAKGYFLLILDALKSCGYEVRCKLLNAKWLGVPQSRQRIIFIGTREDIVATPAFPTPLDYFYTVKEVCPSIKMLRLSGKTNRWVSAQRPAATVVQSDGARTSKTAYFSAYQVKDVHNKIRHYSIPELKKISGFPDDFELTGTFAEQWERIGRAVPPVMMAKIAESIQNNIFQKYD